MLELAIKGMLPKELFRSSNVQKITRICWSRTSTRSTKTRSLRTSRIIIKEDTILAQVQYIGTGRRKSSVARVRLVPGEGKIIINNRDVEDYVPFAALREIIKQPLVCY